MFLTKAEAKRHIRLNKHHYTSEAHTYAMTALRAPKVERLLKILETFDWDSIKDTQYTLKGESKMNTYVVDDSKYKCIYAGTEKAAAFNNEFENGTRVRVWFEGHHIKTFEKEQREVYEVGEWILKYDAATELQKEVNRLEKTYYKKKELLDTIRQADEV